ncbi:MAG TPA: hypothetical protein VGR29_00625 [Thermomicrobiales bacterium]|nr:hypothetical protein [Thermomicrobiales bacterium]
MTQTAFDPSQHLTSIKGQEYLEVKWRLAWLRSEHPDAIVTTQLSSHDGNRAIFSAQVELLGGGSATGWGSETADSFGNYIEKAETKAIGRALAALGFGTQFCTDFDDGPETGVLADAPVQLRRPNQRGGIQESPAQYNNQMTAAQRAKILGISRELSITGAQIEELSHSVTGSTFPELNKSQASRLIDSLMERKGEPTPRKAS